MTATLEAIRTNPRFGLLPLILRLEHRIADACARDTRQPDCVRLEAAQEATLMQDAYELLTGETMPQHAQGARLELVR